MFERQEQVEFHDYVDEKRHNNRLQNPYLARREQDLAKTLLKASSYTRGTFLDIGCGEGTNLTFLKRENSQFEYTGIDFSPAKISFMHQEVPECQSVCGDALYLPFPNKSFEVILCRDLLHHVYWNREAVLEEAVRVLKPGGVILVLESDGRKLLNRIFRFLVPAEKGMKDSIPSQIKALCAPFGSVTQEPLEASFMMRAISFVIGPPIGFFSPVWHLLFKIVSIYENVLESVLPKQFWFYWMFIIRR